MSDNKNKKQYNKKFIRGIILLTISISLFVIDITLRCFHNTLPGNYYHWLEAACYLLFLLGLTPAIEYKWVDEDSDLQSAYPLITYVSIACLVVAYFVIRYHNELLLALSVLMSSVLISIGWFTQAVLQKIAHRRQHTVNTLMQSRMSETYQKRLDNMQNQIKGHSFISEPTAIAFAKLGYKDGAQLSEKSSDLLRDCLYIANYFEYLAISIRRKDLDSDLLFDCWSGVVSNLERKLFYLFVHLRKKDPDVFNEFEWLCEKWLGNNSLLFKYKQNTNNVTPEALGQPYCGLESEIKSPLTSKPSKKNDNNKKKTKGKKPTLITK